MFGIQTPYVTRGLTILLILLLAISGSREFIKMYEKIWLRLGRSCAQDMRSDVDNVLRGKTAGMLQKVHEISRFSDSLGK
jgi:hypothetical protein